MFKRVFACCVAWASLSSDAWSQDPRQFIQQFAPLLQRTARDNQPAQPQSFYSQVDFESRKKIQEWLVWNGLYPGPIDGEFGEGTIAALKKFQTEIGQPGTGILTQPQFTALSQKAAQQVQDAGFRILLDKNTGIRIGIPTAITPQWKLAKSGIDYFSPDKSTQIGLRFIKGSELAPAYERMRATLAGADIQYAVARPEWFVLAGVTETKRFYIRYHGQNGNLAGFFAIYDHDIASRYPASYFSMSSFTIEPFASPPDERLLRVSNDQSAFLEPALLLKPNAVGGPLEPVTQSRLAAVPGSVWEHNGSLVKYVMSGDERYFFYTQPRAGLKSVVTPGTLLFFGRRTGESAFSGKAYTFKRGCEPVPYDVSGTAISSTQIELYGRAAVYESNGCRIAEYRSDVPDSRLVFNYSSGVSQQIDSAPTSTPSPVSNPSTPSSQPKDSARLREGQFFLADIRKFMADRTIADNIDAIGKEAANLQGLLNRSDEIGVGQSVSKLRDLMKSASGFESFIKQRDSERAQLEARLKADESVEIAKNIFFIDRYVAANLGAKETEGLLSIKERLNQSAKGQRLQDMRDTNAALQEYVKEKRLGNSYQTQVQAYIESRPSINQKVKSLDERLGISDKSRFVVTGDTGDVILLYNALPSAPQIAKNVRGDFVFQSDTASLCFSHASPDALLGRFVEQKLVERGVRKVVRQPQICDLAKFSALVDIVAFQRGELLKQRDDYLLALVKLVETASFRQFDIIPAAEVASSIQARQALSAQLESEVETGGRDGYGVIAFTDLTASACLVSPAKAEQTDGLKLLFARQRESISARITPDWKFVEASEDGAFIFVQRGQCGYVVADAAILQNYVKALRREQIPYKFAPVWFEQQQVSEATLEVADNRQQRIRRDAEREREKKEKEVLEEKRRKDNESQKSVVERDLRAKNGVRARALREEIDRVAKEFAERMSGQAPEMFPTYSHWLERQTADDWETFDVKSEVADFGVTQWKGRPLEGIIVTSVIQQKNKSLGQYNRECFVFAMLDDAEFSMKRQLLDNKCENEASLKKWKIENSFKSRWNAD